MSDVNPTPERVKVRGVVTLWSALPGCRFSRTRLALKFTATAFDTRGPAVPPFGFEFSTRTSNVPTVAFVKSTVTAAEERLAIERGPTADTPAPVNRAWAPAWNLDPERLKVTVRPGERFAGATEVRNGFAVGKAQPPWQTKPVEQAIPQLPQLLESVLRSTQPFPQFA
jgi:hypothetical protein